jgi:predicted PurR-regulated permease PerM
VWVRAAPSEVMRTVALAILTAAVTLGALFLLWQVRSFVGWFVIALFLAAGLNPAVNWLERRHGLIRRPLAILLVYLALVVGLLFVAGVFVPLLVDQIRGLSDFVVAVAQAPEGPTEYLKGLARQYGLGWVFERFGEQLGDVRGQLGEAVRNFLLSTGDIIVSAAGFVAALVGATLGGALLVVVGFFVEPWKALVLLVYIVVYQQVEGSVLQPMVYSRAV